MSARSELGTLVEPDPYVLLYCVELRFVDTRPHLGGGVQAVTDSQRLGARDETLDELLVHFLVHRDAARGSASLSGGAKAAPNCAIHGELEVRVVHHDDDILAAHLQLTVLEAGGAGL